MKGFSLRGDALTKLDEVQWCVIVGDDVATVCLRASVCIYICVCMHIVVP